MQFLKKHYEKIILCAVLLGLAAAAIWMGAKIAEVTDEVNQPIAGPPSKTKALVPLDLTTDMLALAQVTNPPPVVLSGEHNLFNPVTWRKINGELVKILKTGPDALTITNIAPLYTVIAYDHSTGDGEGYYFSVQHQNLGKRSIEYAKKGIAPKSGLYIIRGIKGAPEDPTELQLEIPDAQKTVWISKGNPYKQVDGYAVDMKYDPDPRSPLLKERVNDMITLDNELYKIVEITNNLIRVQSINNTKITTILWNGNP
jgi:hypothetical protein